jgi:hypothetical protein
MDTAKNLLRSSIHPQGAGRRVPGGNAATLALAALRGTRFRACQVDMSWSHRSVRLALEPLATVFSGVQHA